MGTKASDGLLDDPASEAAPLFPHCYGTIDFESVVAELAVERDADGTFLSIHGL